MPGQPKPDGNKTIDWGKTSPDYAAFRPGPPESFYRRLTVLGVGLPRQAVLDLGTGTGVLARQFARQGADVTGVDVSPAQIQTADQLARDERLSARFLVASAERLPWTMALFDVATANQCWLYFDKASTIEQLRRVLKPGGLLVTSHFSWLPRQDEIARQSEALVRKFNPDWSAANWAGTIPPCPDWAIPHFNLRAMFYYDEPIAFTRETWRGRIRACRGIGATLNPSEIAQFDKAHDELLKRNAPEEFKIIHRIDAHIFEFKASTKQE